MMEANFEPVPLPDQELDRMRELKEEIAERLEEMSSILERTLGIQPQDIGYPEDDTRITKLIRNEGGVEDEPTWSVCVLYPKSGVCYCEEDPPGISRPCKPGEMP
jgi:hypothetical protein